MLKNRFKSKVNSFFFTLFFKITLFVTLVVLLLSVLLYYNSEKVISTILASSSQQRLTQVSIGAENLNNYISRFTVATYCGDSVYSMTRLLQDPLANDYEKYRIFQNINSSLTTNPFIHSIHMLNLNNNSYYTAGPFPVAYSNHFYDSDILELVKKDYNSIKFRPIARTMPENGLPDAEGVDVLSYIYFERNIWSNSIGNVIVVNVSAENLFDEVNSYNRKPSDYSDSIIVIDKDGNVIAHPEHSLFNKNIVDTGFISTILSSEETQGSFITSDTSERTFVTYSFSEILGWYFISLSPMNIVTRAVIDFRLFTVIICFVILAAGLLLSYYISRKLYSPVVDLQNTMSRLSGSNIETSQKSNEFDTMSLLYKETMEKLMYFRYFKLNNLQALKQNFLRDLLHGKLPPRNELESRFKDYGIKISTDEKFAVIIFRIDDFESFCMKFNQNDRSVMLFAVENISGELLSEHFKCDTVNADVDHAVALLNMAHTDNDDPFHQQPLHSVISAIQENITKYLDFSVTASISPISSDIADLCEIYAQAFENCDYRIIKGYNSIISPSSISNTNKTPYSLPVNKIKNLLDALKLQRYKEAVSAYDKIVSHMCEYSPRVVRMAIPFLFSRIYECLFMINDSISEDLSIDFIELNKKLSNLETIQWANEEFYRLFQAICTKEKENSTDSIVTKALNIIKNGYTDSQLCSESIANQLNLSTVYLRKVFREATGASVSEYINQIRMEKAKELLETSDISISSILEKIGWYNTKYFFNVFKKTYGVTPNECRLRATE